MIASKQRVALAPDHKNISVNLLKNFDEIMSLQEKVRIQYLKNS